MSDHNSNYSFQLATGELRERAIEFHFKRYFELGFYKKDEQDPYQDDSIYFVAVYKKDQSVVGINRLIFRPIETLPTIKEFKIFDLDRKKLKQLKPNTYAEMSALTKLPNHDCMLGTIRETLRYSLFHGIGYWFCSIDDRVHKYMNRFLKFPFHQIGIERVYLGSNTIPCVLDLHETEIVLKESKTKLYEYMYLSNQKEWANK